MDCTIAAGGRPGPEDPLFPYTGGKPKACIDMGGRTMLERVVDALQASRYIEEIVVVGLNEDDRAGMTFARPVSFLPDHGSLVGNGRAGLEWGLSRRPDSKEMLFCSSDIPLITGEIVDLYIEGCRPFDFLGYYTFVKRETMEARFPGSKRTFTKLQGLEVAGGDMILAQTRIVKTNDDLWIALTNARKHAWKLARIVGLRFLLKLLLKRLSVGDIERAAERIIGAPIKIQLSAFAELAMDADKPHQVEMIRREFA